MVAELHKYIYIPTQHYIWLQNYISTYTHTHTTIHMVAESHKYIYTPTHPYICMVAESHKYIYTPTQHYICTVFMYLHPQSTKLHTSYPALTSNLNNVAHVQYEYIMLK